MITLTTLDILYIVLSIFTTIIGTLLAIVLFRVIKILWPVMELVGYYNQLKEYLAMYAKIPGMIKEKVFEIIWNLLNNDKEGNNEDKSDDYEDVIEVPEKWKNNKK